MRQVTEWKEALLATFRVLYAQKEIMEVKMKDVTELPTAGYDLFNLTKQRNEWWKLGGDEDAI